MLHKEAMYIGAHRWERHRQLDAANNSVEFEWSGCESWNWEISVMISAIYSEINKNRRDPVSLVAQMVKRLSAMQETWVWSLGWDDPLEKEMAAHSSTRA